MLAASSGVAAARATASTSSGAQLVHHEGLVVGTSVQLVHLGEDRICSCVDMTVGLGGGDHRAQQMGGERLLAGVDREE